MEPTLVQPLGILACSIVEPLDPLQLGTHQARPKGFDMAAHSPKRTARDSKNREDFFTPAHAQSLYMAFARPSDVAVALHKARGLRKASVLLRALCAEDAVPQLDLVCRAGRAFVEVCQTPNERHIREPRTRCELERHLSQVAVGRRMVGILEKGNMYGLKRHANKKTYTYETNLQMFSYSTHETQQKNNYEAYARERKI